MRTFIFALAAICEESSVGGDQSYVELLTCLEMSAGGHFSAKE